MASKLLTIKKIEKWKPTTETLLADGEGLFCRGRSPTHKDWLFIYTFAGVRRKQGLGRFPDVSLDTARAKASESRALVAAGIDPKIERKRMRAQAIEIAAAESARHTVRMLFEEWHQKDASKRKDGGSEIRRSIEKDVLPSLGNSYANEVRRSDIVIILDRVKARGANRVANQLLQYLRQMFRFAGWREIIQSDPTLGLTKKNVGGRENERDRYLTESEISELAIKLPEARLTSQAEAALWIMLATLCRVGEISKARWQDFNKSTSTWTIPAEHSKNKKSHLVHLSQFAMSQFEALGALASCNVWIFPNRDGKSHVSEKTLQKQFRDRQVITSVKGRSSKLGVLALSGGRWTAHDLRRTGATLMGELGIRSDVIDRCQNHVDDKKVKRIYQRQELMAERQQAFVLLGDRLALLSRSEHSILG